MVKIVVVINTLIALMLLYVAWRVRQLQLKLGQIADSLSAYECQTHAALRGTPVAINTGRLVIHQLRQGPQPDLQLIRVQQVLTLLGVGKQIWQRTRLTRRSRFFRKALAKYR
jgi:flagellar biogenesis protein FliO